MSEKAEKAVQHISDILDEATKPIQQPQPPRVASDFSSTMKTVVQAADDAESVRQHDLDAAVRYKGSQAYEDAIHDADARYSNSLESVQSSAKAALKGIVGEMMSEYQKNMLRPLPDDIFRQAQTFSMIFHPTADAYRRYLSAFQDYPSATEILVSKYKADLPDYVPKDPDGAVFAPMERLSGEGVQNFCDRLLQNGFMLIDGLTGGKMNPILSAQVNGIRSATDPLDVLRLVSMANSVGAVQEFLENVDSAYRPSTQAEVPEDSMEHKYEASQNYQEIVSAAHKQAQAESERAKTVYFPAKGTKVRNS